MFFIAQASEETFSRLVNGVVDSHDADQLRVRVFGSFWKAELAPTAAHCPVAHGQKVQVLGRKGFSLVIAPA
jgi:membrane protein implicated in regulation of membrane protease activity